MKQHTLYGIIFLFLGIACTSLAAIALGTTRWKYNFNTLVEDGLFERCKPSQGSNACESGGSLFSTPYIRATQVFMIIGAFLTLFGIIVAIVIIFGRGRARTHVIAGMLYLIGGLFMLVACSVYTAVNRPILVEEVSRFGYSLWLAWASVCTAFLNSVPAFLAKTELRYRKA